MNWFAPKFRRNPNEKIHSLYFGVADGNATKTRLVKPSHDKTRLEATETLGPMLARGQSGSAGVFILGGLETTLDEMEYIAECAKEKKFVQRRSNGEIAAMCRELLFRRIEQSKYFRKNPSEAPKPKKRNILYLPVGFRWVQTSEPGLKVALKV